MGKNKILIFFLVCYQFVIAQSAPIARNDNYTTNTNLNLNIIAPGILENDDTSFEVIAFEINGNTYRVDQTANFPEGSITIGSKGSFSFIPTTNYSGSVPLITYTVSDGTFTDTANLTISVISLFPPEAKDDYDTVEINTPLNVPAPGVLSNDTDQDKNPLSVDSFFVNGLPYTAGQTASFAEGSITLNTDGSFFFDPTTGYTGNVPDINYIISDGTATSSANLFLTVELISNLIEVKDLTSCNQGYTSDNEYKIKYSMALTNLSTARDFHATNLIKNIDLTSDLDAIFGTGCAILIEDVVISTNGAFEFTSQQNYPQEFDINAINPDFLNATSNSFFSTNAINTLTLYPRQTINIEFCITINPFCNGRPNPTPSGTGIDFDNILNVTSTRGISTTNLLLTDFHTPDAIVTAGLFIPEREPIVNPNGTFDYINTIIITNEGAATANNINYNMGLGDFISNGITFSQLTVTQISGLPVTVNSAYDGDTNTQLLTLGNSLGAGETIILEIYHLTDLVSSNNQNNFSQFERSQTQGILDGFDESTPANKRQYSFVNWSDSQGAHLDRYYPVSSSRNQCICTSSDMILSFSSSSTTNKRSLVTGETPNGIREHQEVQFQLTITNTSLSILLDNLQLTDNLNSICGGNIVAVSTPFIQSSTATINPNLNTTFNGTTSITFFDGISGLLMANESITIQFTVIFNEDCIGFNTASFTATDPINNYINSSESENVNVSSDSDTDGISNFNDIDDDNDTIPDTDEYNGIDPLGSVSPNFIPNYRNTSPLNDLNSDGIVDAFDFDNDGVPNHLDLDSDNDGVLDIVEVENATLDTNNNGRTDNFVGLNGLNNTVENSDGFGTSINYIIPNTDGDSSNNPNFLDIDADGDGIVDNIEAQTTANYNPPNGTVTISGIDTAYPNGISPIDTENDTLFDYVDINSDNDIRNDVIEGWDFIDPDEVAETTPFNIDIDNDGLDDAFDSNNNLINPTNNQVPINFPNRDNVDTPEKDWREINAIVVLLDSVSNEEGNDLGFTISLVKKRDTTMTQSAFPIDINFSTMNGTTTTTIYEEAIAPFDYNGKTSTLFRIPATTVSAPNDTTLFIINSLEDLINELDEQLTLTGAITSKNTLNTEIIGIGTIEDNDFPPSIKMDDSEQQEGVDLVHTIEISHPSSKPIEIAITTIDETAKSPDDYSEVSETITIDGTLDPSNPNLQKQFNIPTKIDNLNELDRESLKVEGTVTSSNVRTQDLKKTGTIIDIDPEPLVVIDNVTTVEGAPLAFTISLLNADAKLMRNYLPININLESISETADVIQDFQLLSTSTLIPANTSSIRQQIETVDDTLNEDSETMLLQATITSTGVSNSFPFVSGIGTIKDNDFPNLFSPNSDGKSDVFKISGIKEFPNFILQIFDRWGSKVYNYKNNGNLNPTWWDGNYKGKPVIEGVYFYTLDFNDGQTPPRTNFIQLIR